MFAAASTAEALNEAAAAFSKQQGIEVRCSFGGSGELARQIEEGAPADVFLSADEQKLDRLVKSGHANASRALLGNKLVVLAAEGVKLASAQDLAAQQRIAVGDPKTVPAGAYAKSWLEKENLWTAVEPKIVPTVDVRAALASVDAHAVDAAIVYRTDAAIAKHAVVAFEPSEQPHIVYPVAALPHGGERARAFVDYLFTQRAAFERRGFVFLG